MPRDYWDVVIGELGGGISFWLSSFLSAMFFTYAFKHLVLQRNRFDATAYAALAMAIFCLGGALRAFVMWMHNLYQLRGWEVSPWTELWPWMGASLIFNAVGAAICTWVVSSWRWRKLFTALVIMFSITVPVVLFFAV